MQSFTQVWAARKRLQQAIAGTALGSLCELGACKDTSNPDQNATCSRSSIVQFATGPKISMGHVLGAEKEFFLIRGAEADDATGRPRRWNPVNPCPRGVPGVA